MDVVCFGIPNIPELEIRIIEEPIPKKTPDKIQYINMTDNAQEVPNHFINCLYHIRWESISTYVS